MVEWLVQGSTHPVNCGLFSFACPLNTAVNEALSQSCCSFYPLACCPDRKQLWWRGDWRWELKLTNCTSIKSLLICIPSIPPWVDTEAKNIFSNWKPQKLIFREADFFLVIEVLGSWRSSVPQSKLHGHSGSHIPLSCVWDQSDNATTDRSSSPPLLLKLALAEGLLYASHLTHSHNHSHKGGLLSPF